MKVDIVKFGGQFLLEQYYGVKKAIRYYTQIKDTYYDTFGFRMIDETIQEHLGFFLDRFNFHISRSRVALHIWIW